MSFLNPARLVIEVEYLTEVRIVTRDRFPDGVAEHLKWYVYRLIDPRNGDTFYVGKGQGDRVFEHARGLDVVERDELLPAKLERIRRIRAAGLEVGHVIHRHGLASQNVAYQVEAAVIDAYPGLTNQVSGHGSGDFGSRHVEEIISEYAGEEFQVEEDLMLISIGVTYYQLDDPYDAVRFAWKVSQSRAERCNLVLARHRGLVVGAYRPTKWLPATRENFSDLASRRDFDDAPDRLGFVGDRADDVWDKYVGRRVPERFPLTQNAIRYLKAGT